MIEHKQAGICAELERRIRKGEFSDKLPASGRLAEEFEVDIRTINKSLSRLVRKGVLVKKRGLGAFVRGDTGALARILVGASRRMIHECSYYSAIFKGVSDGAHAEGCSVDVSEDTSGLSKYDGVIFLGHKEGEQHKRLLKSKKPFVVIEDMREPEIPSVCPDVHATVYRIIRALLESGLRRIAYIGMTTSRQLLTDIQKFHAYLEAVDDVLHAIDFSLVRHAWPSPEYGYSAMRDMLEKNPYPDVVFVTSDFVAPGIYRAASERGLKIPDDIQVLSCDCLGMGLTPTLASIDVPKYEMGSRSVKLLLDIIREPGKRNARKIRLPTGFVPGGSLPAFPEGF